MDNALKNYATLSVQKVLQSLRTSPQGISDYEARERLTKYGANSIEEELEVGPIAELLSHFKNPFVIILLLATSVSAYFGEITNSILIGVIVVASVVLDFFEEHSAGRAARKLSEKVSTTATVIRSGEKKEIKASSVTVGDVVFLSSGDLVPADARIIETDDLFVNQSALTGESFPCAKTPDPGRESGEKIDMYDNVVFLGSSVVSGTARAVIFRIGKETEFGKIAKSLARTQEKSEFELGVTQFGFLIMKITFFLVLLIFLFSALIHKNILSSFLFALAVAVGVTPELLPMITSITMARGSLKMSKHGVIVKKLASIPDFGSMDILCTDKTGTLTEDEIRLVKYTDISGTHDENVFLYTYLNSLYHTGVKNPLDKAVVEYKKASTGGYRKIKEIPFDFTRKIMSVAVAGPHGRILVTKGAPEEVIARCAHYMKDGQKTSLTEEAKRVAFAYYERSSTEGYRVLAVAMKKDLPEKNQYTSADERELELIGFVSFLDPPKKGVGKVLTELEERGIEVKVITGDNEFVTKRICDDVGLNIKGVLLGGESDTLSDDALRVRAEATTVFARFSPDEKNRIITVLKSSGHVVGYLGDGINDAPSLRAADIGISVDNAVDVAKESADIILTKKSLHSIINGVLEGRRSFGNTMKYIMMGLSSNFGNMFSVTGAVFFLPFLPMLPIQILLNNLIYDFSQITIPSDAVDHAWVDKPRKWDLSFIKKFMFVFGPISSVFDFLTFFVLFSIFKVGESVFQTGWFVESLATQTLVIHIIRTNQIPFLQSRASRFLLFSTFAAVAVGWAIPFTPLGGFFQFSPLPIPVFAALIGLVVFYLLVAEIAKRAFYKGYFLRSVKPAKGAANQK